MDKNDNIVMISKDIRANERYIRERLADCGDIQIRKMRLGDERKVDCLMVYIEVATSNMMLEDSAIGKMVGHFWEISPGEMQEFVEYNSLGIADVKKLTDMEQVFAGLLAGNAVFFMDGFDQAMKISSAGYPSMGVTEVEMEKVLRGSREGFSDSVKINSALIRKRLRDTRLKVVEFYIGERSHTLVQMVYMEDLVQEEFLEQVKERLGEFRIDGILDSGMLEQLTEDSWLSPFPQYQTTERPDRAAQEILNGKAVLLCDNSPSALILPGIFHSFMESSEDWYNRFEMASFLRILRYVALAAATLLPGLYLAVIRFHTQILPTNMLLSFAQAREGVPFSSIAELVLLELSFELIREAGVRIPGALGNAMGIVGGLIVGSAAVEANLVSPIVVMVVAITALGSLAIPNEEFASAFRMLKYFFLFLGGYLGIFGIVTGVYLTVSHLAGLLSFGVPYLSPFVKQSTDNGTGSNILPGIFHSFMESSEDWYNRFEMASFLRILRYVALAAATLLPGLYLAVIRFHTQILPTNMLLSFAQAREGVPFSSIAELVLLELSFELIREAGVRIPGALGNAMGIVGGLIVGSAAVEANLVSPIVVMVVAITALGSLAIPNEEFASAFRMLKYFFLFLGGYLGIFGIVTGVYLTVSHLAGLLSFGVPYLSPFVKQSTDNGTGSKIVRVPFKKRWRRPSYARQNERVRLQKIRDKNRKDR